MTNLEYLIYRYLHQLIEAANNRDLTRDELKLIQRMRPWMRAVQKRESGRP